MTLDAQTLGIFAVAGGFLWWLVQQASKGGEVLGLVKSTHTLVCEVRADQKEDSERIRKLEIANAHSQGVKHAHARADDPPASAE